jgi:hypothetical protein
MLKLQLFNQGRKFSIRKLFGLFAVYLLPDLLLACSDFLLLWCLVSLDVCVTDCRLEDDSVRTDGAAVLF